MLAKAPRKSADDGFGGVIISFGPNTDNILDQFQLDDSLVPRLHVLTKKVRSTGWEAMLRTPYWGLTYERASNLSRAMLADINGGPTQNIQVCFLSRQTYIQQLSYFGLDLNIGGILV